MASVPTISVGIITRQEIRLTLIGPFHSPLVEGRLTGECVACPSENVVALTQNGVLLLAAPEILLNPGSADSSFILQGVTIGVQFHWQRDEDQQFVGTLKLVRSENKVAAINVVDLERYLTSVISSEMSPKSSLNLLKAHAVTSRSWLLAQLQKSRKAKTGSRLPSIQETETERIRWYDREDHEQFDVCADDHCQRYQGITKAYSPSVSEAVAETRGQVLSYEGDVCDARFSKCCGGVTELFENVWEPTHHAYLTSIVDARTALERPLPLNLESNAESWIRRLPPVFCNTSDVGVIAHLLPSFDRETSDFFRWRVEYAQDELSSIVREKSGIEFGGIMDLKPRKRGASGRIIELAIVGSRRTFTIGKELEIRRTLSTSHLYSSAFVIEKENVVKNIPSRFVLRGAGWGHGVGLCQIGAAVMGEQGYAYEEILLHYFPKSELTTLY